MDILNFKSKMIIIFPVNVYRFQLSVLRFLDY